MACFALELLAPAESFGLWPRFFVVFGILVIKLLLCVCALILELTGEIPLPSLFSTFLTSI